MLARGHKGGMVTLLLAAGLLAASPVRLKLLSTSRDRSKQAAAESPSTVSLWAATANAPARLAQATTGADEDSSCPSTRRPMARSSIL